MPLNVNIWVHLRLLLLPTKYCHVTTDHHDYTATTLWSHFGHTLWSHFGHALWSHYRSHHCISTYHKEHATVVIRYLNVKSHWDESHVSHASSERSNVYRQYPRPRRLLRPLQQPRRLLTSDPLPLPSNWRSTAEAKPRFQPQGAEWYYTSVQFITAESVSTATKVSTAAYFATEIIVSTEINSVPELLVFGTETRASQSNTRLQIQVKSMWRHKIS